MILIYYSAGGADCDHDVMKWFMKNMIYEDIVYSINQYRFLNNFLLMTN